MQVAQGSEDLNQCIHGFLPEAALDLFQVASCPPHHASWASNDRVILQHANCLCISAREWRYKGNACACTTVHAHSEVQAKQGICNVLDLHPFKWWLFSQVGVICLLENTWLWVDMVLMTNDGDVSVAIEVDGSSHDQGNFASENDAKQARYRKLVALGHKKIPLVVWQTRLGFQYNMQLVLNVVNRHSSCAGL